MSAVIAQFPQAQSQEITIDASVLQGMALCAAKNDTRYYLEGVHIECTQGQPITLVSTDGHILSAYSTRIVAQATISAIVPLPVIKGLPKKGILTLTLYTDNGKSMIDIQTSTGKISVNGVDGTFPNWRSLIPDSVLVDDLQLTNYNPELVMTLVKSGQTVLGEKTLAPHFAQRGETVGVMAWENWIGLIMPKHWPGTKAHTVTEINCILSSFRR